VTALRLVLCLIERFAGGTVKCIADIQRRFNALCDSDVRYKRTHNELAECWSSTFVRSPMTRLLNELTCEAPGFSPQSAFTR
jgi:hypothetical protein